MKKVSYKLESMEHVAQLLNAVTIRGVTLEQAKAIAVAADIIDNHLGVVEEPDSEKPDTSEKEE